MASNAKNVFVGIGGIVAIDRPTDGIVKFRFAIDYSGKDDTDTSNRSGYFDVVVWKDDANMGTRWVFDQIDKGSMKVGSQLAITGRLNHERFTTKSGDKASRVSIVAEAIGYASSGPGATDAKSEDSAKTVSVPPRF